MTTRLIFPDPLEWWAGLEWGAEAAAILIADGYSITCAFRSEGPMFEAVAFAAYDLGILDRCSFDDSQADALDGAIVVLPRVAPPPGSETAVEADRSYTVGQATAVVAPETARDPVGLARALAARLVGCP